MSSLASFVSHAITSNAPSSSSSTVRFEGRCCSQRIPINTPFLHLKRSSSLKDLRISSLKTVQRRMIISFSSSHEESGATFDLKLPRRTLMVQFTCDSCGERTHRIINRVAYERGTIFLQCAGCQQYHKFVDNLGLIVEYDFRNEMDDKNPDGNGE